MNNNYELNQISKIEILEKIEEMKKILKRLGCSDKEIKEKLRPLYNHIKIFY